MCDRSQIFKTVALDVYKRQAQKPVSSQNNKFNNFDGRSYDMNDLERRLVQQ